MKMSKVAMCREREKVSQWVKVDSYSNGTKVKAEFN